MREKKGIHTHGQKIQCSERYKLKRKSFHSLLSLPHTLFLKIITFPPSGFFKNISWKCLKFIFQSLPQGLPSLWTRAKLENGPLEPMPRPPKFYKNALVITFLIVSGLLFSQGLSCWLSLWDYWALEAKRTIQTVLYIRAPAVMLR